MTSESISDFNRRANHRDWSQTSTDWDDDRALICNLLPSVIEADSSILVCVCARVETRMYDRNRLECQSGCISLLKLQKIRQPSFESSNGMRAIMCVCLKIDVKGNTFTCGHVHSHEDAHRHNYILKSLWFHECFGQH